MSDHPVSGRASFVSPAQIAETEEQVAGQAEQNPVTTISDEVWNEVVNEWNVTSLRNSEIAQNTSAYNRVIAELPALRRILESKL